MSLLTTEGQTHEFLTLEEGSVEVRSAILQLQRRIKEHKGQLRDLDRNRRVFKVRLSLFYYYEGMLGLTVID